MKKSYEKKLALPEGIAFDVKFVADDQVDQEKIKEFVKKLKRPTWYVNENRDPNKDTKEYMLQNSNKFDSDVKKSVDPFKEQPRLEWKCSQCGCGTTYAGIDIGHRNNWRDELISAGAQSQSEAKAVYNNLCNLRLECATCNRSHDWED